MLQELRQEFRLDCLTLSNHKKICIQDIDLFFSILNKKVIEITKKRFKFKFWKKLFFPYFQSLATVPLGWGGILINQITEIFKCPYHGNLLMDFKNSFTNDLMGAGRGVRG